MGGVPRFSRFAKLDPGRVGDYLKGRGSRDRDVLYADQMSLVAVLRRPGRLGLTLIVAGLLGIVTMVGWRVGVALVVGGLWLRRRSNANVAAARHAYAAYISSLRELASGRGGTDRACPPT